MRKTHTKWAISFLLLLSFCDFMSAQKNHTRAFLNGYFGGLYSTLDSAYYNNVYVERRDTGLHFSHNYRSDYDFNDSQNATYCDSTGKPRLLWQGCYILDAETISPIENGDFSHTAGTYQEPYFYCKKYDYWPGYPITNYYLYSYSNFFLTRGDDKDIRLFYWRVPDLKKLQDAYLYVATIDMSGGVNNKPKVIKKDSIPFYPEVIGTGSLQAIRHANGKDWWIVFAEYYTNNWVSILIDENGLNPPVINTINEWKQTNYKFSHSAVSPDGSLYSYVPTDTNRTLLLNFDRCSGKMSFFAECKFPEDEDFLATGIWRWGEFSPGGKYFYLLTVNNIYQFDVNASDFSGSRQFVAEFDTSQVNPDIWWIKGYFSCPFRGFDGHMYFWSGNGVRYVHRMEYPDRPAAEVGFQQDYYLLPFWPSWTISTIVDYGMGRLENAPCTGATHGADRQDWPLYPNPTSGMIRCDAVPDKYLQQQLQIIDSRGRHVMSATGADLLHGVDVRQLAPGVYILKSADGVSGRFVRIE